MQHGTLSTYKHQNCRCEDCRRANCEATRRQYAARREELREARKARAAENRVRAKEWYWRNRDRALADQRARYLRRMEEIPEYVRAERVRREMLRRGRKRSAAGRASRADIDARIAYYGGRCWLCGGEGANSIDHVIPLARGGSNWPANLRPAHLSCNSAKGPSRWVDSLTS